MRIERIELLFSLSAGQRLHPVAGFKVLVELILPGDGAGVAAVLKPGDFITTPLRALSQEHEGGEQKRTHGD